MYRYIELLVKTNLIKENDKNYFIDSCSFESKKNSNGEVNIFISFTKLIPPKIFFNLLDKIKYLDSSLNVNINTSYLTLDFSILMDYLIYFSETIFKDDQIILLNIFNRKKGNCENGILNIFFLNKNEEFLLNKNKKHLLRFLIELALIDISEMNFILDVNQKELELFRIEQEKSNIRDINNIHKKQKEVKETNHTAKRNQVGGEKEDISSLILEQGVAIITGEVFKLETIPTKNNLKIFKYFITDYTDSILVKAFPKDKTLPLSFLETIKVGMWIKAKISLSNDSYEGNDLTGIASSLSIVDLPKEYRRKDTYENKRVELINHTNMTAFEGMISINSLLEHSKFFNLDYIAITDKYNCQSFPEAYLAFKNSNTQLIYGVQLEKVDSHISIVSNPNNSLLDESTFTIFDLETTGLYPYYDEIIEFGALKYKNGVVIDKIQFFIQSEKPLSQKITSITKITDEHLKNQIGIKEALKKILDFFGDTILIAHNALRFDIAFLNCKLEQLGMEHISNVVIDTMQVSRGIDQDFSFHSLGYIAKKYFIQYDDDIAHRADFDADILCRIWSKMLERLRALKIDSTLKLDSILQGTSLISKNRGWLINVYCKKQKDLKDFYKIISYSLTDNLYGSPKIIENILDKYRDNFIVTNSPTEGEIIYSALSSTDIELEKSISKYDYILISPPSCFLHEINRGNLTNDILEKCILRIVEACNKLGKKIIASSDTYYLSKNDKEYFNVYVHAKSLAGKRHRFFKYNETNEVMPDLYYRTTNEMMEEFSFLNKKLAHEIIIDNSREFASHFDEQIQTIKESLCSPKIDGAETKLLNLIEQRVKEIYGAYPIDFIKKRIEFETKSINDNGFAVIYWFSHLLVKKSLDDGYLVGSRGSVGSSLVAWLINISEVNPLPAHYLCKKCKLFTFNKNYESGFDMPNIICEVCNSEIHGDGHNIPFETFMGFDGDKTPDIDLNFSALYQSKAHDFIREVFGKDKVFRAGTISTIAEKTAYGYVRAYFESINKEDVKSAEIKRIAIKCQNVKRTTGQHPGGIIVIPSEYDVNDFTPYNFPADDKNFDWFTTHFAFEYLHDSLLKFDILGHDNPTVLKMLTEQTGINSDEIPNNDDEVMQLFYSTQSLKLKYMDINDMLKVGTNGLPEFGTNFVKDMLLVIKPKKFSDLIRISGLSHGTQVWTNNAKHLIQKGNLDISEVISCRDDIMTYLVDKGIEPLIAFKIMEDVRKGKGLLNDYKTIMVNKKIPNWYIESCEKIAYLFPKAHATAYVIMAWKIAWFKMYYPLNFYSSFFSIRTNVFDIFTIVKGKNEILTKLDLIKKKIANPMTKFTIKNKELDLMPIFEIVLEMLARGFYIKNIDLEKSQVTDFLVENDYLIPPFSTIDGLGETVAKSIIEARKIKPFTSKEDLIDRTKLTKTHFKILEELGVIQHLDDDDQLVMFGNGN
ncbi:MAG: PolC-type DNA polymerase III [Malacoplasma sp.]